MTRYAAGYTVYECAAADLGASSTDREKAELIASLDAVFMERVIVMRMSWINCR